MNKLPKLYKNDTCNPKDNNKKVYHLKKDNDVVEEFNIQDVFNKIFNGMGHPYTINVIIKTKDNIYDTYLISRTSKNIITLENDIIPISDIQFIKIKEKTDL